MSALWAHIWRTIIGTVVGTLTASAVGLLVAMIAATIITQDPAEGLAVPADVLRYLETIAEAAEKYLEEG
jgi:ABC-type nitrate/sulfonate/bicarbonate transport system permease component